MDGFARMINLHNMKVIKETLKVGEVNALLQEGWVFLGVFQSACIDSNSYGSFQIADIVYILGMLAPSEAGE